MSDDVVAPDRPGAPTVGVDPQNVQTPNLGLNKPLVGGDDDIWGDLLNHNADVLDSAVNNLQTEVQQLSGALLFIGTYDVVADYAEFSGASGFPNGPLPPASPANFNSYLVATTAGTGHGNAPAASYNKGDWLVSDGSEWVHLALGTPPGGAIPASSVTVTPAVQGATNVQSALQQLDGQQAQYLPLSGGTMAGPIRSSLGNASAPALQVGTGAAGFWSLGNSMFVNAESVSVLQLNGTTVTAQVPVTLPSGDPAQPQYAASKAYVDAKVGSVPGGAVVSPVAPASLNPGALWWDSIGGQLYVRYDDGSSTQWTAATNITGLANAATKADVAQALQNVGRNVVHNSMFNIAQRGAGPWTANAAYTMDRWQINLNLDTVSVVQNPLADTYRAQIGDEAARFCLSNSFTGNAGAGSLNYVAHKIEGVRRLSGKTVTVSFWALCGSGALKFGVNFYQVFGTGGSPSGQVNVNGQSVTLSTTFTRYSLTFTLPSASGMTLGTNGDDSTWLNFWFSCGATNAVLSGSVGVQSGAVFLWGVQLEIAQPGQTQPTPLEKPDPELQLRQCQRFYQYGGVALYSYSTAGSWIGANAKLIEMRANPTIVFNAQNYNNSSGLATVFITAAYFNWQATVTATGAAFATAGYTASADL